MGVAVFVGVACCGPPGARRAWTGPASGAVPPVSSNAPPTMKSAIRLCSRMVKFLPKLRESRRADDVRRQREVNDFGDLPARGGVVLAEVGPPLGVARLARPPAAVAADDPAAVGR